jgi:hypothetical protein
LVTEFRWIPIVDQLIRVVSCCRPPCRFLGVSAI